MKKIITIFCFSFLIKNINAQTGRDNYTVLPNNMAITEKNVNTAIIPSNATTHFVSPEPIQYVDISSPNVQGDLPEKNIFRLRPDLDKVHPGDKFTITIVTQSYISVYKLIVADPLSNDSSLSKEAYVISINPNDAVQVNQSDVLNNQQCFDLCINAMKRNRSIFNIDTKSYGMKMYVKNIFSIGDYIMIELEAKNKTKLQFDIDQIRFKIVDKHSVKATVSQDIELIPFYSLYMTDGKIITNKWRNFYVFKKFTYPTQKLFEIEMTEKQYSGRRADLKIEYNEILKSRQLN
ncbi:MAG: conjugative transposon protein TraN [Bacteroidota bacterium]|nr:conjugative transposon protein TraN [Bacteroidota bacterium]